ncbi:MAG: asparaginase [Melioribacteraceae bacterium]|nr:asparaginase [Melioribacteraceae bacterium]MCF8263100.1 asparaginase [Melioribacteraceae bacterium]MCF8430568.1 asparaginase [Melioribacteraceae bacterium]
MNHIKIVFTGGTFSMKVDEVTGGAVPHFHGNELLDMIPELNSLAKISMYEFGIYPGPHMTPDLIFELANKVRRFAEDDDIDGIIVTHGTDTLEESSYLLDLVIKTEKPIVFIGAMKTSSEPDWDGPKNMLDAVHICNNPNSRNMGVLVCLDGEINAASEVTKTHTEDLETFRSLDFGSLGFVDRGRVVFNRTPMKLEHIETPGVNSNVHLIKTYVGMDERMFKFSADSKIEGLVVEAMGVGNVPPKAFDGIKYVMSKGIPVVLVSRCPSGETMDIYGYPGAGKWLKKEGVIFVEYLNGQKARIKLMLCLGKTTDMNELRKLFD